MTNLRKIYMSKWFPRIAYKKYDGGKESGVIASSNGRSYSQSCCLSSIMGRGRIITLTHLMPSLGF
jgi:hypothetical protein